MAKRVAVIGSGLAGLTTAYLLRREGVEVWLIEKSDKLGFHSASVEIPLEPSTEKRQGVKKWVVDVPMRSFQGALYRHLGMTLVPTYYTYSFAHLGSQPHFIHTGASGVGLPTLPASSYASLSALLKATRHFLGIALIYILWLLLSALSWHGFLSSQTLRELTSRTSYHLTYPLSYFSRSLPRASTLPTPLGHAFTAFIHDIILPLFSAVGTMTTTDVLDTPIAPLLDYVHATLGTSHFTLKRGQSAATVAKKLAAVVQEQGGGYLRLGEEVQGMEYERGQVRVRCRSGDVLVDSVVLATQASAAIVLLGMLVKSLPMAEAKNVEGMKRALSEVEYRETIVVTHRDWSILPSVDRREINLCTPINPPQPTVGQDTPPLSSTSEVSSSGPTTPQSGIPYFLPQPDWVYCMGTHIVTHPEAEAVLQTTNPVCPIDEGTVLAVARMERALPLRDPTTYTRLHPPSALIHLAGSYAYPGIPLLEGCVGSAINATKAVLKEQQNMEVAANWDVGSTQRPARSRYVERIARTPFEGQDFGVDLDAYDTSDDTVVYEESDEDEDEEEDEEEDEDEEGENEEEQEVEEEVKQLRRSPRHAAKDTKTKEKEKSQATKLVKKRKRTAVDPEPRSESPHIMDGPDMNSEPHPTSRSFISGSSGEGKFALEIAFKHAELDLRREELAVAEEKAKREDAAAGAKANREERVKEREFEEKASVGREERYIEAQRVWMDQVDMLVRHGMDVKEAVAIAIDRPVRAVA